MIISILIFLFKYNAISVVIILFTNKWAERARWHKKYNNIIYPIIIIAYGPIIWCMLIYALINIRLAKLECNEKEES